MKNKVLIKLFVPEIDEEYDIFIPVNIRIGTLINLLNLSLTEVSGGLYKANAVRRLYNMEDGLAYTSNDLIRETSIRNGSTIIFI